MVYLWAIALVVVAVAFYYGLPRVLFFGRNKVAAGPEDKNQDKFPRRDLNANINPSQGGNEADLWPDRTGARTRKELGARRAADVTFRGDREEHKGPNRSITPNRPEASPLVSRTAPDGEGADLNGAAAGAASPALQPGVRHKMVPSRHEHGPGTNAQADLALEDEFGENRPAPRTTSPDQPPTQWHPDGHGAPGHHLRDGHHRSASGPIRRTDATDPYAHAPVPGPNHVPPESGQELPPGTHP